MPTVTQLNRGKASSRELQVSLLLFHYSLIKSEVGGILKRGEKNGQPCP